MPQAKTSDDEILGLMRNPKTLERGFRLLMETHQEWLYWQVRRLLNDHEDANDVLQNALREGISQHRTVLKGNRGCTPGCYRIVTNEAITFLNQRKRRSSTSIDDANNQPGQSFAGRLVF